MLSSLLGDPNNRKLKRFSPLVTDINLLEEDVTLLSDEELRSKTNQFRDKLSKVNTEKEKLLVLDELLPEAFAVVREA